LLFGNNTVTELFADPNYRRSVSVWREVVPASLELVERLGGFPAYTLNFRRLENLATYKTSPEASGFR
jgi:hypothetical protein